jgi:hypothetical protein
MAVLSFASFTPAAEARVVGASTYSTGSFLADTYMVTGSITASAGKTITEAGLFDSAELVRLLTYLQLLPVRPLQRFLLMPLLAQPLSISMLKSATKWCW